MSVFRHTPLPQTQQPHRQPSPLKRVEFASKLQEKIHAANAAEHRENFAARKIQPRPAVRPDMTECALLKKCISFKLQNDGSRDGGHAVTLCAQAIPMRSKCRSNGLPTHSPQFRSLLKQKNRKPSPVHGRARQRRARVRANKNQYYIYDVKCAFGDDFFAQKRGKYAFYRAKTFVLPLFSKTGITLDTCRNFASASDPALKTAQKGQKSDGDRLSCGRRQLNLQREKL